MHAADAKTGMSVFGRDTYGMLEQMPNGWDVITESGARLQSVDLSEWKPAEKPTVRSIGSKDTARAGSRDSSKAGG